MRRSRVGTPTPTRSRSRRDERGSGARRLARGRGRRTPTSWSSARRCPSIPELVARALAAAPTADRHGRRQHQGARRPRGRRAWREPARRGSSAATRWAARSARVPSTPPRRSSTGSCGSSRPTRQPSRTRSTALEAWIERIGGRPVRMSPARHDRLVAFVSHLPQVASTALMGLAATEEADEPDILLLAAGGFRDLTRLASSNPALWSQILLVEPRRDRRGDRSVRRPAWTSSATMVAGGRGRRRRGDVRRREAGAAAPGREAPGARRRRGAPGARRRTVPAPSPSSRRCSPSMPSTSRTSRSCTRPRAGAGPCT